MAKVKGTRSKETMKIIEAIQVLADPENPSTARFILYKLISLGILSGTDKYDKLLNILRDARITGEINDEAFVDSKRVVHNPTVWLNLESYTETMRQWYSRDRWATQENRVVLLVEKGTVGDVLRNTCSELQTPLFVSTGYYSRPFLRRLADLVLNASGPVKIGYVGDGDPSGFDIERAARRGNGLEGSLRREGLYDILASQPDGEAAWERVTWKRLAITDADLKSFSGFQLVPVKTSDTRAVRFTEEHGDFGAEVEALDQLVLQKRVRAFIDDWIDWTAWHETEKLENEDQFKLAELGRDSDSLSN